jgi:hypothetical protein
MVRIVDSHLLGLLTSYQMVVAVGVTTQALAAPVGAAVAEAQTITLPLGVPTLVRELDLQGVPGMALPRRGTTGVVAAVARVK